ncbi:hypothetical protein MUY21_08630 [Aliiroseovarius sp. S2029]|uniref:hypothetical protein n=1 Tax=Aliiroseovarius sp. S2029 TaxID=2936988 RepID=UPI0020C02A13|nr:hypothetical protein [Aliiroseovarius sp. S2029]MCK8484100.1 hypothetical protein [Aliiroseovarius sp. S2029]
MLLALGDDPVADDRLNQVCRVTPMSCEAFYRMSRDAFDQTRIDLVTSSLFCAQTDCIEIGQHLNAIGFQGIYLVRADTLPNPAVIRRELKQLYPRLDCRIVTPEALISFMSSAQPVSGQ